jgi:pre-rRNA-processing protein TSR4
MPNLINVLKGNDAEKGKNTTDEERRKLLEKSLNSDKCEEKGEMEWGTCMVFSCENDCCVGDNGSELRECWREEVVLVQWDV